MHSPGIAKGTCGDDGGRGRTPRNIAQRGERQHVSSRAQNKARSQLFPARLNIPIQDDDLYEPYSLTSLNGVPSGACDDLLTDPDPKRARKLLRRLTTGMLAASFTPISELGVGEMEVVLGDLGAFLGALRTMPLTASSPVGESIDSASYCEGDSSARVRKR